MVLITVRGSCRYVGIFILSSPLTEELYLTYSLFCTDAPTPSKKMPDSWRVVVVDSDSMGAAISAACRLIADGVIVWRILGADGFRMERSDIETERLRRQGSTVRAKAVTPPKVTAPAVHRRPVVDHAESDGAE